MRVRFKGLELDEDRRELRRGGEPLPVEPRVFDLIAYLVRHRDRIVSKDELLEQLWPDREVQEGALSVCVHRARRLIEEDGAPAIQTQARRGFRFVAAVELLPTVAAGVRERDLLLGRAAELAELFHAVEEVLPSRLRTVEISGETGIGKTALLEELGAYGRHHKLEVWRAASPPRPGVEPFSLWSQLIGAYVARTDARSVRRIMGEDVDSLSRIVPSLRRWGSALAFEDTDVARSKLQRAIVRSVQAAIVSRPYILLFDDVENADVESLATLVCVLRGCARAPLLSVVAFGRESDALRPVLEEMRTSGSHRRLVLHGLEYADVRSMLEHLAGEPLPASTIAAAMHASGGSPALLEQWWRASVAPRNVAPGVPLVAASPSRP